MNSSNYRLALTFVSGCLLACSLAVPGTAWSHAIVIDSSPAHGDVLSTAPTALMLQFNALIELSVTSVVLLGLDGQEWTLNVSAAEKAGSINATLPSLEPGVYTAVYRLLAADGHITEGEIRFTLLE